MHANAIYNPVSTYTPSEREAVIARRARLQRIAEAAIKIPEQPFSLPVEKVREPDAIHSWVERQQEKYKKPWFHVVADLGMVGSGHSVSQIQRAVCRHYGVSLAVMLSPSRDAAISFPRHIAAYICRRLTKRGYPELGRRFDRDHSTILHGCRKISELVQTDAGLASTINEIIDSLGGET